MKKLYFLVILLFASVLITSCSKKDDNPAAPGETAPGIPSVSFKGPNTSSTDQFAQQTKSIVTSFNAYPMLFSGMFASVKPSGGGNNWNWVLSPGNGATETFTGTKNSDGSYSWKLVFNGTVDDVSYNNFKAMDGHTSADGKSGNWRIYEDNTTTLVAEFSWTTSSSGVLSGNLIEYDGPDISGQMTVVNNTDNSGELKIYGQNSEMQFNSTWKADGTGEWHSYDNGLETTNGNWN